MTTTMSRPALSASGSDPYLSLRVNNTRRSDRSRRPSQATVPRLDAVPEDRRPPPSAYRLSSGDIKGKGKAREEARTSQMAEPARRQKTEWVLDLLEVAKGQERWDQRGRVILVVGSPTADTLAPILYNPTFADTLLLVGSSEPLPSIEALTSPSFLMQTSPNHTVYPTLQPFTISAAVPGVSPIPAIIDEAVVLAQLHRRSTSSQPRSHWRRGSDDSCSSITPPRTPPLASLSHLGSEARLRSSSDSGREGLEQPPSLADLRPDLPKSASETSLRSLTKSRITSKNLSRDSMFGSLARNSKFESKPWTGGSPIDAVINFIPSAAEYQPQRAMQDMLHQAVVLTSGILPTLSLRPSKTAQPDLLPVSLVHVLPSQVPGPLPGVIENFLLGLVPKFAAQSDRDIWSSVTTIPAWLAGPREVGNQQYSGIEALLLGGLRCPLSRNPDVKQRAFLPNWGVCIPSPGIIAASQPRRPAPVTSQSTPAVVDYDGVTKAPPTERAPMTHQGSDRVIFRGEHPFDRYNAALETPELDSNTISSCSSGSGPQELGKQAEEKGEKKKGGLSGWLKSKTKRR